jgi:hypothetical protein
VMTFLDICYSWLPIFAESPLIHRRFCLRPLESCGNIRRLVEIGLKARK